MINEEHYVVGKVEYAAGDYNYDKEKAGTRYVLIGIRTLVDPNDASDLEKVHALQDAIKATQASPARSTCRTGTRKARRRCATRC